MASKKNLHLEHIEDEILNFGTYGARESIEFLQSLRDMLSGKATKTMKVTTKFDGAPAIFCGRDPLDGRFFVGTKGVFNKDPKVIKDPEDIISLGYMGDLADKLRICLRELPTVLIPKGVILQGDLLWVKSDLKTDKIDGREYTIFQPNTIVYAVERNSDLDKKIRSVDLGIVFHTTYRGPNLPSMTASFGADLAPLVDSPTVWYANADYDDFSGSVTMTKNETRKVTQMLSEAGKTFRKIQTKNLDSFLKWQDTLTGTRMGLLFKTYNNKYIRKGERFEKPSTHVKGYIQFFKEEYTKRFIDKVKTEKAKQKHREQLVEHLKYIGKYKTTIERSCVLYNHFLEAKNLIVKKLDRGVRRFPATFVRIDSGYKVVNEEGYVAIDLASGNAVKLVDRLEFSYNNFNGLKNWSS